jgi:putative pyruvate formate lyase activating enzyme
VNFVPSYIALHRSGELARRADALHAMLSACTLCPLLCGNNRHEDERARCYTGALPVVSAYTPHFGEEPGLVGTGGVGNIFFGNCNLRCVYCQNFQISQNHRVERMHEISIERLAEIMVEMQDRGCHSVGFVSPTHVVPQIVRALVLAVERGLRIPLIYNTNAYDSVEVLRLLEGIIDIYLPDLKYAEAEFGFAYSKVDDYPRWARAAVQEMHRQVGSSLQSDEHGVVQRGLIIRHLVLPNDLAGSRETLRWIAATLGPHVTVSVMAQYYPAHRAASTPLLDRSLRESEYFRVLEVLDELGMDHGWVQEFESAGCYRPEFARRDAPFNHEEIGVRKGA